MQLQPAMRIVVWAVCLGGFSPLPAIASEKNTAPDLPRGAEQNVVTNGVRLILKFDEETAAFVGSIQNVTDKPLRAVHIEIHLSGGVKLGPTQDLTLAPGQMFQVAISSRDTPFDTWRARVESTPVEAPGTGTPANEALPGSKTP